MKRGIIGPAIVVLVGILALAGLIGLAFYFGKKSSAPTTTSPVVQASPTPDETANWKTYTNTKYSFSFKYPANSKIVLPSLEDYKYAPDQTDMVIPEKTRNITLTSDGKTIFNIILLVNSNRTIEAIKKNPTQGGHAPVKNMTDAMIDNNPAIRYKLDCTGLRYIRSGIPPAS